MHGSEISFELEVAEFAHRLDKSKKKKGNKMWMMLLDKQLCPMWRREGQCNTF